METDNVLASDFANTFETVEKQEETRLRSILAENRWDFDTWMDLVKHIESYVILKQKSKDLNIKVYREILSEYPLCFGYWRKLADIYSVQGQDDQVIATYEEALDYLPVCIEVWAAYCSWKASKRSEEEARSLFERAIAASGKSFKSCLLWDRYIDFEKSKKRWENVGGLYWRILQVPNEKLHEYYGKFKLFMDAKGRKMEHYGAQTPPHPDKSTLMFDPSDPCTGQSDYETKVEMHYSALCEVHRQNRLKEIITTYEATLKEFNKRRLFEAGIKRTFFHAKSLDEQQLEVWRKYLEFEENEGNYEKIVLLYERAVVPCCYYSEFWERYAAFIYKNHGDAAGRGIFQRAIQKFMKDRPELYLAQGHFEETLGNFEVARKFYQRVYEEIAPGLFDGIFRHLNLERRAGNLEVVESLYEKALDFAKKSEQDTLIVFVSQHLASFYIFIKNDSPAAIKLYEDTLSAVTSKKSLYLAYIESLQHEESAVRLEKIRKTYEKAISEKSELSKEGKEEMWVAYLDFMRSEWPSLSSILEVENRYKAFNPLAPPHKSAYSDWKSIKSSSNRSGLKRFKASH